MSAPLGNKNAYRHGLRSNQTSDPSVNNQLRAFRREIRQAVAPDGQLTVAQEALIQSLVRHETRALLAGHYLRREDKLPVERRMDLLNTITSATAERDKLLARLGIDLESKSTTSIWDALKSPHAFSNAPEPAPAQSIDLANKVPQAGGEKPERPTPALGEPFPKPHEGNGLLQPAEVQP